MLEAGLDPVMHCDTISYADDTVSTRNAVGTEAGLVSLLRRDTRTELRDDLVRDGGVTNTRLGVDVGKLQ